MSFILLKTIGRKILYTLVLFLMLFSQACFEKSMASTTTLTNAAWATQLIHNAYPIWVNNYVRSNGMVYAYDWSTYSIGGHTPMPNSAISEGQSYAMLMSVYMGDKTTFDNVWQWTKANMQTRQDHLFNWWTATLADGTYGPVYQAVAPDGDEVIAFALCIAGQKWGGTYTQQAQQIITDLWNEVVVKSPTGKLYYASGIAGQGMTTLAIDPAYLMPYVYRMFSRTDTVHSTGWQQLASDAYDVLNSCSAVSSAGLPPDWCSVNLSTGQMSAASSSFAADAKRIFWHTSVDAGLGNPKAITFLNNHSYLVNYLINNGAAPDAVSITGQVTPDPYGYTPSMTMLSLAAMDTVNPSQVQPIYNSDVARFVSMFNNLWYVPTPSYYDPAVAWFALFAITQGKS